MRILLVMTPHFGFHEMFRLNLEKLGHTVTHIDSDGFRYKSFKDKAKNFFYKNFLGKKDYKENLRKQHMEESMLSKLDFPAQYFDICLVIRPDLYNTTVAKKLREISKKLIAYQWDGFSRFRIDEGMIEQFDRFAVFDQEDYARNYNKFPNLYHTTNFYFDFLPNHVEKKLDIAYVGTMDEARKEVIQDIDQKSQRLNYKSYFKLFVNNLSKTISKKVGSIIIDNNMLSYRQMVEVSSESKVIIDLKYEGHSGLSFRFYEALYFSQKVITNNLSVKSTDFYCPQNILAIADLKNITQNQLKEFMQEPFKEISKEIIEKYSFTNWWNNLITL